jgi:LacI family transcriptional regulator
MTMATIPRVTLLIETSRGYGRGVLRGVVRYARLHGPWAFYISPGDFEQAVPRIRQWGGTGIIARIETPEIGRALLATKLPIIALDLSRSQVAPDSPFRCCSQLSSDSNGAAELAATHLLDRGFRNYAFVGFADRIWSQRREQAFCATVRKAGFVPHVYPSPRRKADRQWDREQAVLEDWLRGLPKPLGIMACNDDRGRQVMEACRGTDLQVPEEVAVVGVDNDELLCELADPPLSSVALNAERGGFEAAALLAGLMSRRIRKPRNIVAQALGVVTRRSTDVTAWEDSEVVQALLYIHKNAARPLLVDEIAGALTISRRSLEIRFERALDRTLHEEISRVRIERAKQLLIETDLPVRGVAAASGFCTPSYLAQVFKRHTGMTPAQYRQSQRGEAPA